MTEFSPCPGCQRLELHKRCPAHGTPFYCTGIPFTKEVEAKYRSENPEKELTTDYPIRKLEEVPDCKNANHDRTLQVDKTRR